MKISQITNNNGTPVVNHFVITTNNGQYFQSYDTVIAFTPINGSTVLSKSWSRSNTTIKYLKIFLCTSISKKDIQSRVDSGDLVLLDEIKIK